MQRPLLEVDAVVELLEMTLKTAHLQVDDIFLQQKEEIGMDSSLSALLCSVTNIHKRPNCGQTKWRYTYGRQTWFKSSSLM
jgi:hypothetical protein